MTIAAQVVAGTRTAVATVAAALDRLDAIDPHIRAFVSVDRRRALSAAAAVDRRVAAGDRPPLAGVPIAVKAWHRPSGPQVRRLLAAGCVPLGLTAVPRPDTPWQTYGHTAAGPTRNPWRPDRSPGGSSAGSAAAVAAGIVPLATASDGAGSTRIPAAWCGLVGIKPTTGRAHAATASPAPASTPAMSVGGPLARCAADAAAYLRVVYGADCAEAPSPPAWPLRAVWSADLGFADVDPAVAGVARRAAQRLVDRGILRWVDHDVRLRDPGPAWLARRAGRVDHRATVDAAANAAALARVLAVADVLVTPTTPNPAHGHDGPGAQMSVALTWAFNVSGHPAVSLPAGLHPDGCPVGLQVVAPHWHEPRLLRVAAAAERCEGPAAGDLR